ncbi:hypothetical protein Pmani_010468 [Petrolisthes manimaculis]|uniref:Uncharacterized protein n=1 Tax=Petrolisthes manimaculis TaxID=1843537 RepID=A0AAE1UCM3_9EUCA|nr:hypothetical protein Pmani_010468 [Petrolisthes manimaculis]
MSPFLPYRDQVVEDQMEACTLQQVRHYGLQLCLPGHRCPQHLRLHAHHTQGRQVGVGTQRWYTSGGKHKHTSRQEER